jgi:hypothetical protein
MSEHPATRETVATAAAVVHIIIIIINFNLYDLWQTRIVNPFYWKKNAQQRQRLHYYDDNPGIRLIGKTERA